LVEVEIEYHDLVIEIEVDDEGEVEYLNVCEL
jgi:hypothetical protein